MFQCEVLISKLGSIDALSSSAVVVCEVSTLAHEAGDHPVEGTALVSITFLTSAESAEIF